MIKATVIIDFESVGEELLIDEHNEHFEKKLIFNNMIEFKNFYALVVLLCNMFMETVWKK